MILSMIVRNIDVYTLPFTGRRRRRRRRPRKRHMRESLAVELRLGLLEVVVTTLFTFTSLMVVVSSKHTCTRSCVPRSSPMCPPTVPVEQALATGFAAAVSAGLSLRIMNPVDQPERLKEADASGAAFNPAVAVSLALRGHLSPRRLLVYVVAELLGGILGAAFATGAGGHQCLRDALQTPPALQSSLQEVLLTAVQVGALALVYLWSHRRLRAMPTPIIVGFAYLAAALSGSALLRGHVLNPARAFGVTSIAVEDWQQTWHLWLGALCGALAAAGVDALLFAEALWMRLTELDPLISEVALPELEARQLPGGTSSAGEWEARPAVRATAAAQ